MPTVHGEKQAGRQMDTVNNRDKKKELKFHENKSHYSLATQRKKNYTVYQNCYYGQKKSTIT